MLEEGHYGQKIVRKVAAGVETVEQNGVNGGDYSDAIAGDGSRSILRCDEVGVVLV